VVEGDDDRGGDLAGDLVGGQVLEELDQGPAVAVRPVAGVRERAPHLLLDVLAHLVAQVGVGGRGAGGPGRVGLTGVCAATSAVDPGRLPCVRPTRLGLLGGLLGEASWGGDLLDRLDQHRAGEGGDGEVAAGGAVTLVVPGEPGLLPRGVLLGLGAAVLVGIHLLGRALGGGQGPAGDLAQLGGRETCRLCHQVRLDRGPLRGAQVRRELRGRARDHGGVIRREVPVGQGFPGRVELLVQGLCELDVARCSGAVGAGGAGNPGRRPRRPGRLRRPTAVGLGQHPQPDTLQPADHPVHRTQGCLGRLGADHVATNHPVQHRLDLTQPLDRPQRDDRGKRSYRGHEFILSEHMFGYKWCIGKISGVRSRPTPTHEREVTTRHTAP
jgi:hypothetical protein